MKLMVTSLSVALVGLVTAADAESHLVPTLERNFEVCNERPLQPEWVTNLDNREANKARLIQQIYRSQSMERIANSDDCSCETRFSSWDAAVAVFVDRHATDDRNELRSAISDYRRSANAFRKVAMPICEAAGNW